MRIDKLIVANFKGFEFAEFKLNPHFTVFIGDNAKGKTSVLDALSIAAGSFFLGIDVASQRGVHKDEIRIKTIADNPKPQLPVSIKAIGVIDNTPMTWERTVDEISKKITTKYRNASNIKQRSQALLNNSRRGETVTFPVIAYHGTGRLWAEHESVVYKKNDEGVEMAYKNCLSPKSSSREFLSWYKTIEDEVRKFEKEEDLSLLAAFKNAIMSMLPGENWSNIHFSYKDNDLIGVFTTPEGKNEKLRFKQLSDGYRNIIALAADIAYRCIKLNPHLGINVVQQTTGIILIDEIDQNIHPKWQKRLVQDFKRTFPNIQFIATTHSPFIVQSLNSDELYNLDCIVEGAPTSYSIGDISTYFMGVDSGFSIENQNQYKVGEAFLFSLENENISDSDLDEMLSNISDPSLRAFLQLNRMAKRR